MQMENEFHYHQESGKQNAITVSLPQKGKLKETGAKQYRTQMRELELNEINTRGNVSQDTE